jgi:hypothetical protein
LEEKFFSELRNNMNSKFLATVGDNLPTIMCEEHAKMFEKIMIISEVPHTIYEMEDEDSNELECQACNLKDTVDEMNRPKIILPGDYH